MNPFPTRISIFQWIVQAIGIPVEILRVVGALNVVVGREEGRHVGVVDTAVHVDETEVVEVLVQSVTAVERGGDVVICEKFGRHRFSFSSTFASTRSPVLSSTT